MFDNSKISQGLSFQYSEKIKEKKSSYKNINNKEVANADYNGNDAYMKLKEGLSAKEKKHKVENVVFKENYFLDRKYIQDIYDNNNAQEQALFLESLEKRRTELNAYIITGSKAHAERITAELKRINEIMDYFQPVIDKLVTGGVMQKNNKGNKNALFKID